MERAVEQSAYELTCLYEDKIRQLTVPGAQTLALCAVGRFIEFMRNEQVNKQAAFSNLVLESIRLVKPTPILDLFPWTKIKIETQDHSLKWTEPDVFQGTSDYTISASVASDSQPQPSLTVSQNFIQEDQPASFMISSGAEIRDDGLPNNSHKGAACCTIS